MTIYLRNFFIITVICTIFTLSYVHQNIEIVKLGYSINRHESTLSYYLDQHRQLVYNLNKLESPTELARRLCAEEIKLVEADINSIYYAGAKYNTKSVLPGSGSRTRIIELLLDAFTTKAEAKVSR